MTLRRPFAALAATASVLAAPFAAFAGTVEPAAAAPVLAPAAATTALPEGCEAWFPQPGRISYLHGRKFSLYSPRLFPTGSYRHADFASLQEDDLVHSLAVYADGTVREGVSDFAVMGEDGDLSHVWEGSRPVGRTLKNVVDLGPAAVGESESQLATPFMYALTSAGRLYTVKLATSTSRPVRLGAAAPLTAKGLPALKGFETVSYFWDAKNPAKVVTEKVLAQTKDGRLLRIDIDRRGAAPKISSVHTVDTGWKNVAGFTVGGCHDPSDEEGPTSQFLVKVGTDRSVTGYLKLPLTPVKLGKHVNLVRWVGPLNAVY